MAMPLTKHTVSYVIIGIANIFLVIEMILVHFKYKK